MIVPFVHDGWMLCWLGGGFGELPMMVSAGATTSQTMGNPWVARVGEDRQMAIMSTTRAREPRAGIPQVCGLMRIDLSFLLRSDNPRRAWRIACGRSKEVSRGRRIHSMAIS